MLRTLGSRFEFILFRLFSPPGVDGFLPYSISRKRGLTFELGILE